MSLIDKLILKGKQIIIHTKDAHKIQLSPSPYLACFEDDMNNLRSQDYPQEQIFEEYRTFLYKQIMVYKNDAIDNGRLQNLKSFLGKGSMLLKE